MGSARQEERRETRRSGAPFGPLVTPAEALELERGGDPRSYDAEARDILARMARFVLQFLTSPHPMLGRPGAVCPYASKAVEQGLVQLTAFRLDREDEDSVRDGMALLRTLLTEPDEGGRRPVRNRALIAVFPGFSAASGAALIERVQKALKLSFVERRLMIGQFYPTCPEPGLWNPDFRPLQSPVISLAIRNITLFDAPFMLDRREYIDAFVGIYGPAGEEAVASAAAKRLETPRPRLADAAGAAGAGAPL